MPRRRVGEPLPTEAAEPLPIKTAEALLTEAADGGEAGGSGVAEAGGAGVADEEADDFEIGEEVAEAAVAEAIVAATTGRDEICEPHRTIECVAQPSPSPLPLHSPAPSSLTGQPPVALAVDAQVSRQVARVGPRGCDVGARREPRRLPRRAQPMAGGGEAGKAGAPRARLRAPPYTALHPRHEG